MIGAKLPGAIEMFETKPQAKNISHLFFVRLAVNWEIVIHCLSS